jgi:hypothetical protein
VAGKNKGKNNNSELRYVPCRVEPGMFRGEYLVYLDALNPSNPEQAVHAQLFADERDVAGIQGTPERNRPVPAWLAVSLVRTSRGLAQIVLPQPAQPLGENLLIAEQDVKQEVGV